MTTYLGGEKAILSLGNLQLRRSQCQPAHVELQVLEDLVLESNQFQNFSFYGFFAPSSPCSSEWPWPPSWSTCGHTRS